MSSPSGLDQADVQNHQALIEKLDRRTRVIMSLNSSFFDLLGELISSEHNVVFIYF